MCNGSVGDVLGTKTHKGWGLVQCQSTSMCEVLVYSLTMHTHAHTHTYENQFSTILGSSIWTYSFARAAITKYHKMGVLTNRNLSSHSSGGQKSEIKVLAELSLSKGHRERISSRSWPMDSFSFLCLHITFPL
jgi:hypothetical protein